jgi:putative ABC transport system permease protein
VRINDDSVIVVGILPSDFRLPTWDTVIWRANAFTHSSDQNDRPIVYVRFAPDVPREDALRVAMNAARAADGANAELWPRVNPVAGMVLDSYYQRALPLLAGGVILVFLVLCANVCSLLLARLRARRREFGMRSALGASRARLMRQSLVESCLVGMSGVLIGLGIAWMLVSLSRAYLPEAFLLRTLNPLNIDLRALVVTSTSGVIATLAAGLLPAWLSTRLNANDSLRVTDRGGTETRGARTLMRGLLVAEIALACTLLVGATLLVRSFVNLSNADRGLDARGVVTATISLPRSLFRDLAARTALAQSLTEQIRALPGVQQVAWSFGLPPGGGGISFGDWQSDAPGTGPINLAVESYQVGQDFFELYGIPLLRGRTFQQSDASTDHVVVGERLARTFWPGLDPIGRSFTWNKDTFRVVGVVKEIHHPSLDPALDRPEYYYPVRGIGSYTMMSIRCAVTCPDEAVIRQRLVKTHAGLIVHTVARLEDKYFEELARPRAAAALGLSFATIAIIAAAGGLFSVLSYAVGRRKREFGIRTALGASPAQIRRIIVSDGLLVAATGVAIGGLGAWSVGRALASLQYGVTMNDPASWALVLAVLGFTTAVASWRPARQATRVDPVLLLRDE